MEIKLEIIRFDDKDIITTSSPAHIPKGDPLSKYYDSYDLSFAALTSEVVQAYGAENVEGTNKWHIGQAESFLKNEDISDTSAKYASFYFRNFYYTWYDEICKSWRTEGKKLRDYAGNDPANYEPNSGLWPTN